MSYLVLARKWRPRSFDTLVGQEHVVRALTHALTTQRLHHAWLFTGTRGVGKTTLSRILAKSLNCETGITATPCGKCRACTEIDSGRFVDYLELDAASNRGVDEMTQLLEQAVYSPTVGRFKVYMIDEVHMLTGHAFNAMLKTLEEPPPHVKFILATTDPQKIPVTVLSRCLQFNLKQMPPESIVGHLGHVLAEEQIPFEVPALRLIGQAARGSMRDALSLTDQAIAFSAGNLSDEAVRAMLGTIDQRHLVRLLDAVADGQAAGALAVADDLATRSLSYSGALADLAVLLSQIAIAQRIPGASSPDDPLAADIARLAARLAPDAVQLFYSIAVHSRSELALAPDEYAGFVMACLRMLAFTAEAGGAAVRPVDAAATGASSPGAVANAAKPVESAAASVKAPAPVAEVPASGADALATEPAVTASAIAAVIAPEPNASAVASPSADRSPVGAGDRHASSGAAGAKVSDSTTASVAPATPQGASNLPTGELVPTGAASTAGELDRAASLNELALSDSSSAPALARSVSSSDESSPARAASLSDESSPTHPASSPVEFSPVSTASSSGESTHADTAPSSTASMSSHAASSQDEPPAASQVAQSSSPTKSDAFVAAKVEQSAPADVAATAWDDASEPVRSAPAADHSTPMTDAPAGKSSLAPSSDRSTAVDDDPPFEPDPRPASTFTADAPPQRVRPSPETAPAPAAPHLDAAPEAFSQPVNPAGAGFSPSGAPAPINSPRAALAAALEGKGKPPPKRVEPKPAPAPAPRQNDSSDSEPPPWLMEGLEPSFAAPPGRHGAGQESASNRASAPAAGRSQPHASTDRTQPPAGTRSSPAPAAERAASAAPERAAPSRSSYAAGGMLNLTESWPDLAARLPVRGVAAQLARQSELVRIDGNQLVLRVATRTLSEGQAGDRLRQVLEDHFGQAVRLTIEVGETGADTAYAVEQSERSARQQAAEDAIMADPFVRALLDDFGGRIVPNSIRPVSTDSP